MCGFTAVTLYLHAWRVVEWDIFGDDAWIWSQYQVLLLPVLSHWMEMVVGMKGSLLCPSEQISHTKLNSLTMWPDLDYCYLSLRQNSANDLRNYSVSFLPAHSFLITVHKRTKTSWIYTNSCGYVLLENRVWIMPKTEIHSWPFWAVLTPWRVTVNSVSVLSHAGDKSFSLRLCQFQVLFHENCAVWSEALAR